MADTQTIAAPRSIPHWGLFGTVAWGASIALAFVVVQSIVLVAYLKRTLGETDLPEDQFQESLLAAADNGVIISLAMLATTIICVPMILGIAKLKRGSRLTDYLALNPIAWRTLGVWLSITIVFIALADALTLALGRPVTSEFMLSAYRSANPAWLIWLAFVVGAPLFEETFFRGFLFKGLQPALTPVGAIVVTAAVWAAIHIQYDLYGIVTLFISGLLLGAARVRTNSLFTPLAMHALMNIVANSQAALAVNG